jgi:cyclase
MDNDGTKKGFAIDPLAKLNQLLQIPVIASGGAGKMEDFLEAFVIGKADAALAATLFHFGEIKIPDLKNYLKTNNLPIRI